MAESFEDRDLSDAEFWGVNLQRSSFRDVDLTETRFFHTLWRDVEIDGMVTGLVVNGVDVTDYVNAHDRWYPLRTQLSPATETELRSTWSALCDEWSALLSRVAAMDPSPDPAVAHRSVNGEWSLRDTLRHLLFAMDKWFSWPLLGHRTFSAIGLPNTGSQGRDWPGLDRTADPDLPAVLAARRAQADTLSEYLSTLDLASLPATADVEENGTVPTIECFHVVFEEEFEHLRYALRDLDLMAAEDQ